MDDLFWIAVLGAGLWYWWDTLQSKELALTVCRQKCEVNALQLLDSTVTRQRTWLRRSEKGSLQICRLYSFEYSVGSSGHVGDYHVGDYMDLRNYRHGDMPGKTAANTQRRDDFGDRVQGYIVLLGKQVVETSLPHISPSNTRP